MGSPLQLCGPADRGGGLQFRRGGRLQARDVVTRCCLLSPCRVDESGGTRTAVSSTRCPRDRFPRALACRTRPSLPGKSQIDRGRSAPPETMAPITLEEFQKVEMRVGRIVAADDFPEARNPSYKLRIDFGPHGVRASSAAVQPWYPRSDLVGRPVIAVTNFPPRQIGPFMSEVLCLGAVQSDGRVILLRPDTEGELGARIA